MVVSNKVLQQIDYLHNNFVANQLINECYQCFSFGDTPPNTYVIDICHLFSYMCWSNTLHSSLITSDLNSAVLSGIGNPDKLDLTKII